MKKIFITGGMAVFFCFAAYGCAAVLVGGGVAGGIAISKDTVELNIDKSYNRAWAVCIKEIKKMNGHIKLQDKKGGKIEADIKETQVEITLTQLTQATVQIQIKARKNYFPNIELANELSNKISADL